MDVTPTTLLPQTEDDLKALLQRLLSQQVRKVTTQQLAAAARTVTTSTGDILTNGYSGLVVMLSVNVGSGTGGLTLRVQAKDPNSAFYMTLATQAVAVVTSGGVLLSVGPGGSVNGATAGSGGLVGAALPDTVRVQVIHGDASSYTYSLSTCLIP